MPALSHVELCSRLAYDFRAFESVRCESFYARPFASIQDANGRVTLDRRSCEEGHATVYHVTIEMEVLIGREHFAPRATIRFDLLGGGNYPFTPPVLTVVSRPYPWHPHVEPSSGIVCHGLPWARCSGQVLAVQLALQIMRVLNFEPDTVSPYHYNQNAYDWWREHYDSALNPDVTYPVVPIGTLGDTRFARTRAPASRQSPTFLPAGTVRQSGARPAPRFEPVGAPPRGPMTPSGRGP